MTEAKRSPTKPHTPVPLELALTGLMPPEMEWDALDIIDRLAARGRVT